MVSQMAIFYHIYKGSGLQDAPLTWNFLISKILPQQNKV